MGFVGIDDVKHIVDETLLRLGNGMQAVRGDTARFSRTPVEELLPRGIADTEWIPIVGDRGWVMISNDRRPRARPAEAQLAIAHRLEVVHLHGKIGSQPPGSSLCGWRPAGRISPTSRTSRGRGGSRDAPARPC
jgi:hypothetical protein